MYIIKKVQRFIKKSIYKYEDGLNVKINEDIDITTKYKEGNFILVYFDANRASKVIVPNAVNKVDLQNNYSIDADIDSKFLDYLVYLKTQ